jgi:hypothetical protein
MDFSGCQLQLRQNCELIRKLVADISPEQARRKPSPDDWSVLEVINHLYDEEREDFRQRFDYLLHRPGEPWPPIDPQGWVTERHTTSATCPLRCKTSSMSGKSRSPGWPLWTTPPSTPTETHPVAGEFHAGDMLAAWVAHDVLHLRQLIELKYFLLVELVRPYNPQYAGDW